MNDYICKLFLSVQRVRMSRYEERCFQYVGPKEWNELPLTIRNSKSLEVFKYYKDVFIKKTYLNNRSCYYF